MLDLYFYNNSVCSERVLMCILEKGIDDWTGHHIDLFKGEQAEPEYIKLNPKAQVPTLVHDGHVIRESSIICDYLDNLYPENPLKPIDAAKHARMREWIKAADEAGFQGVGALSFAAVFREKLSNRTENERHKNVGGTEGSVTYVQTEILLQRGLEIPLCDHCCSSMGKYFRRVGKDPAR